MTGRAPADFDSGYEEKYDFRTRAVPPEIIYMLAAVPRTGSTYLSHLLWSTGCLGSPLEYLNFEPGGHYAHAAGSPELQDALWSKALQTRTSPNGVFGFKCFLMQLHSLDRTNPALYSRVSIDKIVYLARRDRTKHVVSYARAHLSRIWTKEQSNGLNDRLPYSQEAVDQAAAWIESQTLAWERLFEGLRIEPLRLWYEDVVASPQDAIRQVCDFLGVTADRQATITVPAVHRQSGAESRIWAETYERSLDDACQGSKI